LKRLLLLLPLLTALGAERPPIVGIANFVVKTDNLDEVRKFYTGVLGYDEVFRHRRPGMLADIAVFKVNDHQYIEVTQTLANYATTWPRKVSPFRPRPAKMRMAITALW
jgi:catechol 2,3-dioxygenase-like lactoylglutathione lyase family enzyme